MYLDSCSFVDDNLLIAKWILGFLPNFWPCKMYLFSFLIWFQVQPIWAFMANSTPAGILICKRPSDSSHCCSSFLLFPFRSEASWCNAATSSSSGVGLLTVAIIFLNCWDLDLTVLSEALSLGTRGLTNFCKTNFWKQNKTKHQEKKRRKKNNKNKQGGSKSKSLQKKREWKATKLKTEKGCKISEW